MDAFRLDFLLHLVWAIRLRSRPPNYLDGRNAKQAQAEIDSGEKILYAGGVVMFRLCWYPSRLLSTVHSLFSALAQPRVSKAFN